MLELLEQIQNIEADVDKFQSIRRIAVIGVYFLKDIQMNIS